MSELQSYIVKLENGPTYRVMAFSKDHAMLSAFELCADAKVLGVHLEMEWTDQ